ncbi:hypothetical protein CQW23_04358 [Capsicum baccatum]|uniref:Ubiquitin-like protease family profile domain-containing protein n=1 Tax=Capsicum baccatum TaxID=33114 RepID=A0A2G2XED9_CAPBA|nr:hypothetical protein CQW23_04358 [Capsicum baccatum]
MGDLVVMSVMGKSFDAFKKILREQKLDSYFRESCFRKYLDLLEDNNARFQMKMVYDLLKRRFMYENKDKMDEVLINYCGMPVCFGWEEFAIVTKLKRYPPSPSQVIPTLTQKKAPYIPKKGKNKSSDRDDLVSIVGPSFKNKNLIEALKATDEEYNMTVDNPSAASKDEEKVDTVSLGERKNYPFEGFNILDEAPKKLIQLINDYSEWIIDGLLKHHVGSIPAGLPWHLVDEVYIPINCGDEFHWVLAVVILKERHIRVYDSMLRRRRSGPSSEIQKLAKILPTYLDMSDFLDQKIRTDWSTIEAYREKMANPFDVQYVDGITQQTIGSLDYGPFVTAYAEYLTDGLQVPNDGLDAGLLRKRYAALL